MPFGIIPVNNFIFIPYFFRFIFFPKTLHFFSFLFSAVLHFLVHLKNITFHYLVQFQWRTYPCSTRVRKRPKERLELGRGSAFRIMRKCVSTNVFIHTSCRIRSHISQFSLTALTEKEQKLRSACNSKAHHNHQWRLNRFFSCFSLSYKNVLLGRRIYSFFCEQ